MLVIPLCGAEALTPEEERANELWIEVTTPLYKAVTNGDMDQVVSLIKKGIDVNGKNKARSQKYKNIEIPALSETPLYAAISKNDPEKVRVLLDNGAIVNVKAPYYGTPLHYAVFKKNPDIVRLLIDRGADVNAMAECKDIARIVAGGAYWVKGEIFPLHALFGDWKTQPVEEEVIMKMLIDNGADVNARESSHGFSPLHSAAINEKLSLVKMLVERGADVNARGKGEESEYTPLSWALINSNYEMVEYLRTHGAIVTSREDTRRLAEMDNQSKKRSTGISKIDTRPLIMLGIPLTYFGTSMYMYESRYKHDRAANKMGTFNAYAMSMTCCAITSFALFGFGNSNLELYSCLIGAAAGFAVAHYTHLPHRIKQNRVLYYGSSATVTAASVVIPAVVLSASIRW